MYLNNLKKKGFNLNSILFLLLCTIPFTLVWSRFLADLSVVLICIIFLIKKSIRFNFFFKNFFFKFFFVFWILILLRSLFSEDIYFSLKSSLPFIRFAIFALAIQYLVQDNPRRVFVLLIILLPLLCIVAADGLFQFYSGKNILGYQLPLLEGRLSGFFKDELIIGSYLARFSPILIGLYYYSKYHKYITLNVDYYFFIVVLYLFFLVICSGERVSIAYFFISLFLLIVMFDTKSINKIIFILATFAIFTFSIISSEKIKKRLINDTLESVNFKNQTLYSKQKLFIYSIQHQSHIISSYKIFKENILLGSGVKMFRKICEKRYNINEFSCTTHPHNLIMQFLSETGILGLLFYILSLFYILFKLFKLIKFKILNTIDDFHRSQFFFLIALLISLFPILPSGSFFNNWIAIISFFPAGLYLATTVKKS
jgi:O-antigen ligase